ncbi:MAG: hypothetical protein ACFFCS_02540 [Candidatus Hodarchaeota archaeon]
MSRENQAGPTAGTAGSHAPGDHVRPVTTMAGSAKGESPTFRSE